MPPLSWMPGAVNFFLLLLCIYPCFFNICLHFFSEISLVGCPPHGCPGPSHPTHPSLHATVRFQNVYPNEGWTYVTYYAIISIYRHQRQPTWALYTFHMIILILSI